jgi:hypothetical protein|tara:strand:+ start:14616 stop:14858 length:243 start_codon:yes stop_codon:yes gene_type:complete
MKTFTSAERIKVLTEKFETLTEGMENWKMPIKSTVHITQLGEYREACEFFTGAELNTVKQIGSSGMFQVYSKGYYNAVGS